jgi:hypothetical protein
MMPTSATGVQIRTYRKPSVPALMVCIGCLLLAGCGGTGDASPGSTPRSTSVAKDVNRGARPAPAGDQASRQNAEITKRDRLACEQAVQYAPALAAAAKEEIAALCFRINYIPEDNERTVRSVCQEVANASSLTSEDARKRTVSACYAAGMR